MKKKELIDEVERHGYRLNSHHRLIKQLLEENDKLEWKLSALVEEYAALQEKAFEHIERLNKKING